MHSLAKARRAKRYQSGALSLNTPKLSFKLDETGNPAEFGSYPIRDSNRLVEVGYWISAACALFNSKLDGIESSLVPSLLSHKA